MKHSSSLGRLRIESLALPEEMLQALKAHRFRSVGDIMAFGVSNVVLLCRIGESGSASIDAALRAPDKSASVFTKRVPFKMATSFEQKVDFSCSEEFLSTPVTKLRLSSRAAAILHRLGLKTIGDILVYGIENFASVDTIGELTCANIQDSILDLMDGEMLDHGTSFSRLVYCLLPPDEDKRNVMESRFGLSTGKGMSIPEVANSWGMSEHRVGKIILREMRKMTLGKAGVALQLLRERFEVVLIRNGHIVAFEDLPLHPFFRNRNGIRPIVFMINLLCALFPKRYRIIDSNYLTCLSPREIAKRTEWLKDIFEVFLRQIAIGAGSGQFPPSPRYVLHCLHKNQRENNAQPEPYTQNRGISPFGQKSRKAFV